MNARSGRAVSRCTDKSNITCSLITVCCTFLLMFLITPSLKGQIDTGRILGVVTDQSGAVVPGAKVTLTNQGTGLSFVMTTGPTGNYVFPGVRIGTYQVTVEANGFAKFLHPDLPLHVQEDLVVDARLVPGAVTQTIEVTGAAPLLQTQNSSVGQVIGASVINDLPLNGRDYTTLAWTVTGVSRAQFEQDGRPFIAASGHPTEQTYYTLNGINNTDEAYANPEPYIALPPPDALAEFKLQTDNYSAEFGHSAGALINATMKAGTNQIHGTLWEFVRNDKFDSTQFFLNAANAHKAPLRQNQFGASLGGPVLLPHIYDGRNKTFFFVDYQGTRIRNSQVSVDSVPTATEVSSGFTNLQDMITYQSGTRTDILGRVFPVGAVFDPATTRKVTAGQVDPVTDLTATTTGYVRDPFYLGSLAGMTDFTPAAAEANINILPISRLDQNAVKLLGLYPLPQRLGVVSNYTYNGSFPIDTNGFDFRVDQNFSARDQLFVTADWYHRSETQPGAYPGVAGDAGAYPYGTHDKRGEAYAISETHTFSPTTINEVRLGYSRSPMVFLSTYANTPGIPAQYGIQGIPQLPGYEGLPPINISGLTSMGTAAYLPQYCGDSNWDLTENLTKVHGAHTFKGGFQGDLIEPYCLGAALGLGDYSFDGSYTGVANQGGSGLAQLLLTPTTSSVGGFNGVGGPDWVGVSSCCNYGSMKREYLAGYLQDDWKITRKLTLNLGVRWDRMGPYTERYGANATFLPGADGSTAKFIITQKRCNTPLSASFAALTQKDGISVACSPNNGLADVRNDLFSPRIGLAYRLTSKLVARAGYGMFYGDAGFGMGDQDVGNYPFAFQLHYSATDTAHPIIYPDGSAASLESGLSHIPLSPASVNAEYLYMIGTQWNRSSPRFTDYNFSFQYQLTAHQSFQLAYVGNTSDHTVQDVGSNKPSEILPPGLNTQEYLPYPDFSQSTYYAYNGNSYYNSLQATFERSFSGGLTLNGNWTYSKCLADGHSVSLNTVAGFRAPYLPGFGIKGDYTLCEADIPNILHFSGLYSLPVGKGRYFLGHSSGLVDQVIGGWRVNWIVGMEDGVPFSVGCPIGTTSDFGCYAFLVPGQNIYAGPHNVNQWLNPAAFAQPPVATTVGQTDYSPLGGRGGQAHGPAFHRLDFSAFKEFRVSEGKRLEFRAEFFNLTNTPWFGNPSYLDFTNTKTFGTITSVRDPTDDPRQIQFALKFYW